MAVHEKGKFARVYNGLRRALAHAELRPAAQLRIDEIAERYDTSTTPVREALGKLAGERLVHGDRRQGFFVPCLTQDELADLFVLSELLIIDAVRSTRGQANLPAATVGDRIWPSFLAYLLAAGRPLIFDMGSLVLERLSWARRVERDLIAPLETAALSDELANSADARERMALVRSYHRQRRRLCGPIARAIRARAERPPEYIPDMI